MNRSRLLPSLPLGLLSLALVAGACSLNPQPLPPGNQPEGGLSSSGGGSGSSSGSSSGTGGSSSSSGSSSSGGGGSGGSSGGLADAGAFLDAGTGDAATLAPDASDDGEAGPVPEGGADGETDAPSEATLAD